MNFTSKAVAFTKKKLPSIDTFIFSVFFMVLIPMIVISAFVHPEMDDYGYAAKVLNLGFWEAQLSWYYKWTGKYFSCFIMSLNPLVYNNFFLFKVAPVGFILGFVGALFLLIRVALPKLSRKGALLLTASMNIVYFSSMPDLNQGFYWLTGAAVYQVGNIFTLLFFALWIKVYEKPRFIYVALSLFCVFAIIGSNETSMLFMVFFLCVALAIEWIEKRRVRFSTVLLLLFSVMCSLVVILAPGNSVRSSRFANRHDVVFSIFYSGIKTITLLIDWIPGIILISIVLWEFLKSFNLQGRGRIFSLNPLVTIGLIIFIPFVGVFPSSWSTGLSPSPRVSNVSLLFVVLGGILFLINVIHYAKKQGWTLGHITPSMTYLIGLVFVLYTFRTENIQMLYFDLLSGRASAYNTQMNDRYALLRNAHPTDTIVLPGLVKVPSSISSGELRVNQKNWYKASVKSYFNSGPIMIKVDNN